MSTKYFCGGASRVSPTVCCRANLPLIVSLFPIDSNPLLSGAIAGKRSLRDRYARVVPVLQTGFIRGPLSVAYRQSGQVGRAAEYLGRRGRLLTDGKSVWQLDNYNLRSDLTGLSIHIGGLGCS
jgi:hypothetical protein